MYLSLWAFWLYVPLLLVAFVLSIGAMSQGRIGGGILLLLVTLILPPVQWICLASFRGDEWMKAHKWGHHDAEREMREVMARTLVESQVAEAPKTRPSTGAPTIEAAPTTPSKPEAINPNEIMSSAIEDTSAKTQPISVVKLTSDTAPIVYEIKSERPTAREEIAKYVFGNAYEDLDEFSRRDFVHKLNLLINKRTKEARPEDTYSFVANVRLGEYDFEKSGFPIQGHKFFEVCGTGRTTLDYEICLTNREAMEFAPVDLKEAKLLATALRASREAEITCIGSLDKCVSEGDSIRYGPQVSMRAIYLNVSEIKIALKSGGPTVSIKVPQANTPTNETKPEVVRLPEQEALSIPRQMNEPSEPQVRKARPVTPVKTAPSRDRVADFVRNYVNTDNGHSPDLEKALGFFAENVDYYDDGRVDKAFIRKDIESYDARWPQRKQTLENEPSIDFTTDSSLATARFAIRFSVQNAKNYVRGRSDTTMMLALDGDTLRIIAVSSTVSEREKGNVSVTNTLPPGAGATENEQGPSMPATGAVLKLSPERVVTDVFNNDPRTTVANFRSQYSGKTVRYTETVVRKNPKEQLLVLKGGGFLTSAYDVQVSLNEDYKPGFDSVNVGDRLTIVGTLDRLVTPAFGIGSNSIRINGAQVTKRTASPAPKRR